MNQLSFILSLLVTSLSGLAAETLWSTQVYQTMDRQSELNQVYFQNVLNNHESSLFDWLLVEIDNDNIPELYDGFDDQLNTPISKDQIRELTTSVYEIHQEEIDTLIYERYTGESVVQYRIIESIGIDNVEGKMLRKIVAICPVLEVLDNYGEHKGYLPLFYVKVHDMESFLRSTSVRYKNDSQQVNFWNLLSNHYYDSVTYKVSSIYNDKISSYTKPEDIELEIQRINNLILKKEEEIWNY